MLDYPVVPRVLVCDDAPGFRLMLGLTLRDAGWEVAEADSYVTALLAVMSSLDIDQARDLVSEVRGIDMVLSKRTAPEEIAAALDRRV